MKSRRKELREKFGGAFLIFFILNILIFFIFPDQLAGNIYILIAYLIGCLIFLYLFYNYKRKLK